ncbi:hypothetical protein YC2023_087171 [Brassica napus]
MEHWADLFGLGSVLLFTGLPIPSQLSVRTRAKAGSDSLRAETSSVLLPLLTVEGLRAQAVASRTHYDPISRLQLDKKKLEKRS